MFEQIGELCYFGNGMSYEEVYRMPVRYRNIQYLLINEFKKKEASHIKSQKDLANKKFPTGKVKGIGT
jgi:hypothetical protein